MDTHVRVTGWREGAKKVSASVTLKEFVPLDLAEAKRVLDDVLDGEAVTLPTMRRKRAVALVEKLTALRFEAELEERNV
ncbi:MAG: hypothetical protein SynsKO_29810 [Synoicihabitans sp.]